MRVTCVTCMTYATCVTCRGTMTPGVTLSPVAHAQLLELCDSPFVVKLLAAFQDENHLFLATEFLEGGTLHSRLADAGKANAVGS